MTNSANLAANLIKQHEGLRLMPYRCSEGYLTIGYGRNLETRGITETEAAALLATDIAECVDDLMRFTWWPALKPVRQAVLIDMRFNLGAAGLRKFRKMLTAIQGHKYHQASAEMLDSLWARQVGDRANRLARMMATGEL